MEDAEFGCERGGIEHVDMMIPLAIRAVTVAALAPRAGELLWDVGAGSGSIAVEWCRNWRSCTAVAFERDERRRLNITFNAAGTFYWQASYSGDANNNGALDAGETAKLWPAETQDAACSISGGTDVCSGIVSGYPLLPVYEGEIAAPCLGVDAVAYDPNGRSVVGELGERMMLSQERHGFHPSSIARAR